MLDVEVDFVDEEPDVAILLDSVKSIEIWIGDMKIE